MDNNGQFLKYNKFYNICQIITRVTIIVSIEFHCDDYIPTINVELLEFE